MKISRPIWGRHMETIELPPTTPRLITAGCSFATKPFDSIKYRNAFDDIGAISWTEHLANKTDRVLIDWAKIGSGCGYAHRVIIDSVLENLGSDMMVVVGWSSIGRWETFADSEGNFLQIMLSDMRESHEVNVHKFYDLKEYKQHAINYTFFQDHLEKLNYIISLGGFLESLNVKYLFFNAFEPLDGWKRGSGYYSRSETGEDSKLLQRATDYIKNNLNWLDKIQIELGAKDGYYQDIIHGNFNNPGPDPKRKKEEYFLDGWHPSPLANEEWSEILYNEICNRY
jgi:hypothetical protein